MASTSDTTDRSNTAELEREIADEPALTHKRAPLPPEMEHEIELRRQHNVLAATIAGLSWGKQMSPVVRRAFADYCARFDVDPITEMDNLGGQPYVNADWYKRKLGELVIRGIVRDYTLEHVQADPRLKRIFEDERLPDSMRNEARDKWFRNAMRRIEQNAPDEAEAVCICSLHLPNGTTVIGCKWAGGGTSVIQPRHGGGGAPNPIAENNPTLSVESMSIRRALSQLLSHVSGQRISAMEWPVPALDDMKDELRDLGATARAENPPRTEQPIELGTRALTAGGYDDASEISRRIDESKRRREGEESIARNASSERVTPGLRFFTASADPYGFSDSSAPLDSPVDPAQEVAAPVESESVRVMGRDADDEDLRPFQPPPGPPSSDLFGGETRPEPTALDTIECEECENQIRAGHPEDHDPQCDGFKAV